MDERDAEIARLRAALEGMLKWFGWYPECIPADDALGKVETAITDAREALARPATAPPEPYTDSAIHRAQLLAAGKPA